MAPRPKTPEQRFWPKVDKTSTCWLWTGALTLASNKHVGGYGRFRVGAQMRRAHRYAYELLVGPIPAGLDLDHLCNNRRCVNPAHLEPVTRAVNISRRDTRGQVSA